MRFLTILLGGFLLGGLSASAFAADSAHDKLEPLPPPVFAPGPNGAPDDEPEITIIKQTELTVEEFRSGGRLYMIKVIPKVGPAYYLVDDKGDGRFSRQEGLDTGVRPPQWIIHRF